MEKVPFRFRLEYQGYKLFEKLIVAIPERVLPLVATLLAGFVFYIVRIRRQVTLDNLALAFPDKPVKWHKQVGFRSYRHFIIVISEFMKMARWNPENLRSLIPDVEVEEFLADYRKNRGVIGVSGHFGNWEVGPVTCICWG
jgi:KDO2-lipid IV(A) lauroyltransferase